MPVQLRVRISHSHSPAAAEACAKPGAVCCVVGDSAGLGRWDPKNAPKLSRAPQDGEIGTTLFEGSIPDAVAAPGVQFKYCVLHLESNTYAWEQQGPLHSMPAAGAAAATDDFESAPPAAAAAAAAAAKPPRGGAPAPPGGAPRRAAEAEAEAEVELGEAGVEDYWMPWAGTPCSKASHPRTIFHAFHWPYAKVTKTLQELHDMGFTAVQLSPAQKSTRGNEWWTRYQPHDYHKIEGYGSLEDLRELCSQAGRLGMMVIGDVVFNHMLVVASAGEWEAAQRDEKKLVRLQQKLAEAVGPTFAVEDFQWPWFKLAGSHWDNYSRYEGWGNGEWSELRHCKKVVKVHNEHLQLLLDAGVRGIRFDAVKHMRTEHVAEYIRYLSESGCGDIFSYGEVLSVDANMQHEYMDPLQMPTTDFGLTVFLKAVLCSGMDQASKGPAAAAAAAAGAEGLALAPAGDAGSGAAVALSTDSIRFARNHDTVNNPGAFYGLSGSCRDSRTVWVWLLAVHDGSVLVYPEDLFDGETKALMKRALRFRAGVGAKACSTEVCLRYKRGGAPPQLVAISLRDAAGQVLGLCLLNTQKQSRLRVSSVPMRKGSGAPAATPGSSLRLASEEGVEFLVSADGSLKNKDGAAEALVIQAEDAAFLVAAPR